MSLGTDRLCLCAHPEGEHAVTGECAIHRKYHSKNECGCPRFTEVPTTDPKMAAHCALCGRGANPTLEVLYCSFHHRPCCRLCFMGGRC